MIFALLIVLSTGYEFYKNSQTDTTSITNEMYHDNLTVGDTSNDVQLNGIKAISAVDLEINGKVSQEINEATEQKVMNGSTVVMVQHSNQNITEEKKAQGIVISKV